MGAHRVQTIGSGMNQPDMATWNASLSVSQDEEGQLQSEIYTDGDVTISSSSATDILLTALPAERGTGIEGTGPRLVRSGDFRVSVQTQSANGSLGLRIGWLEIDMNSKGGPAVYSNGSQYGVVPIWRNSIIHDQNGGNSLKGFVQADSRDMRLQNVIAYKNVRSTSSLVLGLNIDSDRADGGTFNCVVYGVRNSGTGPATGMRALTNSSNGRVKNNMVAATTTDGAGAATDYLFGGTNTDSDYNLSEDATADDAGGANHTINSTTPDWVDPTGTPADFHLNSEASDAHGTGVDLEADNGVEVDIDGTNRHAGIGADPWDKGAHQFVPGGGGAVIDVVAGFGSRAGFALQPPQLVINAGMLLANEVVFADQNQMDLNALAALATALAHSSLGSMDLSALSGLGAAIQQGMDAALTAESVVAFDLEARAAQTQAATLLMAMSHGLTTQAQLSPQTMLQTMSILALASGAGFAPLSLLSLQVLGVLPVQVALALQSELPVGLITAIVGLSSGVGVVAAGTLMIGGVTAHPLLAQLSPQSQAFISQLFSLGGIAAQGQGGGILHEMIMALGGEAAQSVEQQHVIGNILALALRQSIDTQTTNVSRALLAMGCTADQLALGSTIISQMLTMTLSGALASVSASNALNIGNIAMITAERLVQPTVTGEKFI